MGEPRYVPQSDGQPADIEESPEPETVLPFDAEAGPVWSLLTAPPRCSECDGTRGMHKTNCPHYKDR